MLLAIVDGWLESLKRCLVIGGTHILLTEDVPLESGLAIPEEGFVVVLLSAVAQIVGVGNIDLRLHIALVGGLHVPLEGHCQVDLHTSATLVADPQEAPPTAPEGASIVSCAETIVSPSGDDRGACAFFTSRRPSS